MTELTQGSQSKGKMALMVARTLVQRQESALDIKILAMSRRIFDQVRAPTILADDHDKRLALAEKHGIGIVLDGDTAWIMVFDDTGLWRWRFANNEQLDVAFEDYPWMATLPQIFLTEETDDQDTRAPIRVSRQRRREDHQRQGPDRMGGVVDQS